MKLALIVIALFVIYNIITQMIFNRTIEFFDGHGESPEARTTLRFVFTLSG